MAFDQAELDKRMKAFEDRAGLSEETRRPPVEVLQDALAVVKKASLDASDRAHGSFQMASQAKAAQEDADRMDKLVLEVEHLIEGAKQG